MYNIEQFIEILKKCQKDESLNEYAKRTNVDAGYLSRIINKKKKNPPSPKVLEKIAASSHGEVTYKDLMLLCGYVDIIDFFFDDSIHQSNNKLPLVSDIKREENFFVANCSYGKEIKYNEKLQKGYDYFAYNINDDSMAPLLNIEDIAIIEKEIHGDYENGKTYLLEYANKILIRKILEVGGIIELHAMNPYYPIEKVSKEQIIIIGKVIKAEIKSAFN